MSNPLADHIPSRFLPLAALVAGRPDAAVVHLTAAGDSRPSPEVVELRSEIAELRAEIAQLREELSFSLAFIDRLGPPSTPTA
ncbi:MAG: hypothetical protein R2733_25460 [Acidimicrobiales bacterium]